jgi:hypothetical protein
MIASSDNQRALVDTNIVVYAYDSDDPSKHTVAQELIERLSNQAAYPPPAPRSFAVARVAHPARGERRKAQAPARTPRGWRGAHRKSACRVVAAKPLNGLPFGSAQRPRNFIASSMPVYSQDSTGITAHITVFTEIS